MYGVPVTAGLRDKRFAADVNIDAGKNPQVDPRKQNAEAKRRGWLPFRQLVKVLQTPGLARFASTPLFYAAALGPWRFLRARSHCRRTAIRSVGVLPQGDAVKEQHISD